MHKLVIAILVICITSCDRGKPPGGGGVLPPPSTNIVKQEQTLCELVEEIGIKSHIEQRLYLLSLLKDKTVRDHFKGKDLKEIQSLYNQCIQNNFNQHRMKGIDQ